MTKIEMWPKALCLVCSLMGKRPN